MGIKGSKDNQLQAMKERFTVLQEHPDRNISHLEEKDSHREFLLKQVTFNDKNEFTKAVEKLESKKTVLANHPHLVPLAEYLTRSEDQFCSTFYKIYALFEYPFKTLQDEINERHLNNKKFVEKELWSILASCILGLSHLQKNGIKHQGLRSTAILLTSNGVVKVADPYCTSLPTNYETLQAKRNTPHIYLSPEEAEALARQEIRPQNINPYKSDVFTIGMIILEAGLLEFQDSCYRDEGAKVHWESIKYNIQKFGESFSPELKVMIEHMLLSNPSERPEWINLENYVKRSDEVIQQPSQQTPPVRLSTQPPPQIVNSQQIVTQSQQRPPIVLSALPSSQITPGVMFTSSHVVHQQPHSSIVSSTGAPGTNVVVAGQPAPVPIFNQIVQNQFYNPYQQPNPAQQPITNLGVGIQQGLVASQFQANLAKKQQVSGQVVQQPLSSSGQYSISFIKPSDLKLVRPVFSGALPANAYLTNTKTDQNMIEVDEDEQSLGFQRAQEPSVNGYPPKQNIINPIPQGNNLVTANLPTGWNHPVYPTAIPSHTPVYTTDFSRGTPNIYSNPIASPAPQTYPGAFGMPPATQLYSTGMIYNKPPVHNLPVLSTAPHIQNNIIPGNYYPQQINLATPTNYNTTTSNNNVGTWQPINDNMQGLSDKFANVTIKNTMTTTNLELTPNSNNNSEVKYVIETFKQGSRYEGEKVNGMRHGRGKFFYQDGGLYDGEWRENKMSGHGKLYYQSGNIAYDGHWNNDQFTGFGTLHNEYPQPLDRPFDYKNFDLIDEFWTRFEGQFMDDLKQGRGKLYLSNKEVFEGLFDKDAVNGSGKYITMSGQVIQGVWRQNRFQRAL